MPTDKGLNTNNLELSYLVVDSSKDLRQLLLAILKPFAKEVRAASSVEQGASQAKLNHPDVVITSCGLHDTGTVLCRTLRQETATADLPVVILTTSSDIEDYSRYFLAGCDQIVLEPFRCKDIFAAIRQARERNRAETRSKVPVLYYSGKAEYVAPEKVDNLIRAGEIKALRRGEGCAVVGRDRFRSGASRDYPGAERRRINHRSIGLPEQ